jgi:hypothetical protein
MFYLFCKFSATNVAEEVNNDDSVENTIRSEFVVVTSTTKKKNDGKEEEVVQVLQWYIRFRI